MKGAKALTKTRRKIQIRLAKTDDCDRIIQIASQVQKMVKRHRSRIFGKLGEFSKTRSFYLKELQKKDSVIYVAKTDEEVAGYAYAIIERTPDDLIAIPYVSFNELAVDRKYHGQGIAPKLMSAVHRYATTHKIKVIQLAVWEFNENAVKLYEKTGYKTIMRKMEKVLPRP